MLSDIFKIALGVALGNKISNNSKPQKSYLSDRQCLWGTGMCPYGKKNEKGWSIGCNIGCPLWTQCGGRR